MPGMPMSSSTSSARCTFVVKPVAPIMAVAASIALVASLVCFFLLMHLRDQDINLRSVWLCSRNGVLRTAIRQLRHPVPATAVPPTRSATLA
jgi:hypothetical protein